MAKSPAHYPTADVKIVAETIRAAKDRGCPIHLLIGAGCSKSAGVPLAPDLIKEIKNDFPGRFRRLSKQEKDRYGAVMKLLSINERRDLLQKFISDAKTNWAHIAMAQLMGEGYVSRVLTLNFDPILPRACSMIGLYPAIYDFGSAPAEDTARIASPSIIYLHGQSYGMVLLNTDDETLKHAKKLKPVIEDSIRSAPRGQHSKCTAVDCWLQRRVRRCVFNLQGFLFRSRGALLGRI